jgi:hypothetical protein
MTVVPEGKGNGEILRRTMLQPERESIGVGAKGMTENQIIVSISIDRNIVGIHPRLKAHVLQTKVGVRQTKRRCPEAADLKPDLVRKGIGKELELLQVIDQKGGIELDTIPESSVNINPHHQVILVTKITLRRPVEHHRVEVHELRPPITIDDDLVHTEVKPRTKGDLRPVSGDVPPTVEESGRAVDEVRPNRVGERRVKDTGQRCETEATISSTQPNHIEGWGIIRKNEVRAKPRPPGEEILPNIHTKPREGKDDNSRCVPVIDSMPFRGDILHPLLEDARPIPVGPNVTPLTGVTKPETEPERPLEAPPRNDTIRGLNDPLIGRMEEDRPDTEEGVEDEETPRAIVPDKGMIPTTEPSEPRRRRGHRRRNAQREEFPAKLVGELPQLTGLHRRQTGSALKNISENLSDFETGEGPGVVPQCRETTFRLKAVEEMIDPVIERDGDRRVGGNGERGEQEEECEEDGGSDHGDDLHG